MPKRVSQFENRDEIPEDDCEHQSCSDMSEDEFEDEMIVEEQHNEEEEEQDEDMETEQRIFRPGVDQLEDGEELVAAPGTYKMLHRLELEWPCMSFDFIEPNPQPSQSSLKYPLTTYVVAGTQADSKQGRNKLYVMRWHKLHRMPKDEDDVDMSDDDSDDDESSDEDMEEEEAALDFRAINHPGCVNRIRAMPQAPHIVATWAGDEGKVMIWNIKNELDAVSNESSTNLGNAPNPDAPAIFSFDKHETEGYSMAWSPHVTGEMVTGDCKGGAYKWQPVQGGKWAVESIAPNKLFTRSVEDLQFKKTGTGSNLHTIAACGGGGYISVMDVRQPATASFIDNAHGNGSDVNVLSWNPVVGELLLTGADDGSFKVWDARKFGNGAMAHFHWHTEQITSVDWHATDETVLAVASADDSISLWDMSVEADDVEVNDGEEYFPPQLLFLHQGQRSIKEVKFHSKYQGVVASTALDGFNIFKTINI